MHGFLSKQDSIQLYHVPSFWQLTLAVNGTKGIFQFFNGHLFHKSIGLQPLRLDPAPLVGLLRTWAVCYPYCAQWHLIHHCRGDRYATVSPPPPNHRKLYYPFNSPIQGYPPVNIYAPRYSIGQTISHKAII